MSKIEERVAEARALLRLFGMDTARTNVRSGRVLLSMLGLRPDQAWSEARNSLLGTRAIMDWIRDHYGVDYKPNTRETVRRETLHQFVGAHLTLLNPDNPARPVNSPDSAYQVTDEALGVIRLYGTPEFAGALADYLAERPGLKVLWAAEREMDRIPLALPGGRKFSLTPGGQNELMKQIVEDFCPRFTPGGELLYIGDAGDKWAMFERDRLASHGVKVDEHGKMPDLVVYMPDRNWLVLMEAASSHGPVDSTRYSELSALFVDATAGLVYVSCFPDRAEFRRYSEKIAWETEVWCADNPTHMIHYNGERFLGPYE